MQGLNQVTIMGRLGQAPELKNINGMAICNFSIATSKSWKDDGGEKQERTEWHNCVAFKKTAELAGKYLVKGSPVLIVGELQTRSWDDKKTGDKKYRTEIIANNIQFIPDGKRNEEPSDVTAAEKPTGNNDGDSIAF